MHYQLPTKLSGYLPKAMAVLESLRGHSLNHFERGYRHPIDIYSTAIQDLLNNLNDLLDIVEIGQKEQPYLPENKPNDWEKKLIRQLDHTADSIVQYFDSCRAIIHCCFGQEQKTQFTKAVRRFNTSVKPHTDRITTIVNFIKHKQRTLNLVYFHNPGMFIPGYYVEGILEPEIAGPDPIIHPGSNTAISLYREIPAFVCALYFVPAVMANEICATTNVKPAKNFKPTAQLEELALSVLKKLHYYHCNSSLTRSRCQYHWFAILLNQEPTSLW